MIGAFVHGAVTASCRCISARQVRERAFDDLEWGSSFAAYGTKTSRSKRHRIRTIDNRTSMQRETLDDRSSPYTPNRRNEHMSPTTYTILGAIALVTGVGSTVAAGKSGAAVQDAANGQQAGLATKISSATGGPAAATVQKTKTGVE